MKAVFVVLFSTLVSTSVFAQTLAQTPDCALLTAREISNSYTSVRSKVVNQPLVEPIDHSTALALISSLDREKSNGNHSDLLKRLGNSTIVFKVTLSTTYPVSNPATEVNVDEKHLVTLRDQQCRRIFVFELKPTRI